MQGRGRRPGRQQQATVGRHPRLHRMITKKS